MTQSMRDEPGTLREYETIFILRPDAQADAIAQRLGTQDFIRVRVGISRPDPRWDPADYVLSDFTKVEQKEVPFSIVDAADAVETVVKQGTTAAMNRFNRKKDSLPPER